MATQTSAPEHPTPADDRADFAALVVQAERDLVACRADNVAKSEAFLAYCHEHGVEHEDGCPEDDTCRCPLVVALNAAFGPRPGDALLEKMRRMEVALRTIEAWDARTFPRVPDRQNPGQTISYGFAYGSMGERDYMRGVAREALAIDVEVAP